jgi:DNA-binding NtrC family response regulator
MSQEGLPVGTIRITRGDDWSHGRITTTIKVFRDGEIDAMSLKELEKTHILNVLHYSQSVSKAAAILGINRRTIYRKLKEYGVESKRHEPASQTENKPE